MTNLNFLTTYVGSVSHPNMEGLTGRIHRLLDVPAWPQLSRRSFRENMYVQYSPRLPAICENVEQQKIYFDTRAELADALKLFIHLYYGTMSSS